MFRIALRASLLWVARPVLTQPRGHSILTYPVPSQIMTKVVHCKKASYDVYIGRPSKWGNPFTIGKDGTRKEVIAKYRTWILSQPNLLKVLEELRNKTLGCWCSPLPCHGDVLIELLHYGYFRY